MLPQKPVHEMVTLAPNLTIDSVHDTHGRAHAVYDTIIPRPQVQLVHCAIIDHTVCAGFWPWTF